MPVTFIVLKMLFSRGFILLTALLLNVYLLCIIFIAIVGENSEPGGSKVLDNDGQYEYEWSKLSTIKTDKIVLFIIDAMRFDFVAQMKFVSSLLNDSDAACLFKVHLEGPTVTLPRIKALVTGASSSYWDFLANLKQSSGISTDNLITNAETAGKEIVFYGDDTWLKLFPNGQFKRSEGVTSFFVTDFFEVDNNVTRNVDRELEKAEFDLMILHYLGVDHVGHVHGPKHPLIMDKLFEMDSIIQRVFNGLNFASSSSPHTILITGDHGMATAGGHGGDSLPEVTTPLVVISVGKHLSPICSPLVSRNWFDEPYEIRQNDIAPTLSFLWDLPLPSRAKGVIASEILETFPHSVQFNALRMNAKHLLHFLPEGTRSTEDIMARFQKLHEKYLKPYEKHDKLPQSSNPSMESILLEYKHLISLIQLEVVATTKQDLISMFMCSGILLESLLIVQCVLASEGVILNCRAGSIFAASLSIFIFIVLQSTLPALMILCSLFLWTKRHELSRIISRSCTCFDTISLLWHTSAILYFSSSFVEEEHFALYFCYSTSIVLCAFLGSQDKSVLSTLWTLLVLHRLCSSLNSTGQKWNFLPDLNYESRVQGVARAVQFTAIAIILTQLRSCWEWVSAILIGLYKLSYFDTLFSSNYGHWEAKLCYISILLSAIMGKRMHKDYVESSWALLCALLLRPKNTILVPLVYHQARCIQRIPSGRREYLAGFLALCSFFYVGNSNNVSTIDISLGYTGLASYNEYLVGLLTFISTYALPILVIIVTLSSPASKSIFVEVLTCKTVTSNLIYSIVLIAMRQHLFIWSVFVPKLLYLIAFTFLTTCVVLVVIVIDALSNLRWGSCEQKIK